MDEYTVIGLKVPLKATQTSIMRLKELALIHPDYKLRHTSNHTIIPVYNKAFLSDEFPEYELVTIDFEPRSSRPSSLKEALMNLLPEVDHNALPTAFDQIGKIVVIDLKESMLPFKEKVAEAFFLFKPTIICIYRKSGKVTGVYRIPELELIGGSATTQTVHQEHGIEIEVDLQKVYFSPRLATEHARIASLMNIKDKVLDLFGGLAPFGLHITYTYPIVVDSVDHNPSTSPLIEASKRRNKLQGTLNHVVMDSQEYIIRCLENGITYTKIIMNHPSGSENYLNSVLQILRPRGVIYYYKFAPMTNYKEWCRTHLYTLNREILLKNIHIVRQSSPSEFHVCMQLEYEPDQIAHH